MPLNKSFSFKFGKEKNKNVDDERFYQIKSKLIEKKTKNTDEHSSSDNNVQIRFPDPTSVVTSNTNFKHLAKHFSFSVDLINELRNNNKFKEKELLLTSRLSRSYTDIKSKEKQAKNEDHKSVKNLVSSFEKKENFDRKSVAKRKSTSLTAIRPSSNEELVELLKSINEVPNNNNKGQTRTENKFPPYDVDVECRNKPEIRRNRLSKTTDFDVGRKKIARPVNPKNFDIRGVIKLQVSTSDKADLIKCKDEYLAYENDNFYRINLKTKFKSELYSNVIIKSVRYQKSNKECKEIELKDIKNVTYILHFEDWKRAKQFIENEKIQVYIPDNKVTLMQTLRKLLGRRESQDSLEKRGIYKNEPIFGNTLKNIRNATNCLVPIFITEIIKHLEKPENIKNLGLYRTSGNLAVIQKIRFEVDNGKLTILDQYSKDPDVLTGSLKLFFRELKEPLISRDICDNLLEFTKINPKDISSRDRQRIKDILVENMDKSNLETLVVIIKHLIEVVKYKEFNKMDSYNLAICWGPSLIFSIAKSDTTSPIELSKDIVSLSQDATRLVDFFLTYYEQHPAELDALKKRPRLESLSDKMQTLKRQDSRDSDWSMDSFRSQKTSTSSNLSLSVDEVVRKLIEFIEVHIGVVEDLYRKSGSADKTSKIMKKLNKKKIHELDKYKYDAYELTDALKRYLRDQSECLIGDRTVESVLAIAPDNLDNCLESVNRRQIIARIEDTPKKDTLIFLLRHIAKVLAYQENNFNLPRKQLLTLWSAALINPKKMKISNENFTKFLAVAVKVFDDNLPDIVKSSFSNKTSNRSESMDELMKEMKFQHNKQAEMDRNSRYDNVDSDIGEATILEDDKTEETKL